MRRAIINILCRMTSTGLHLAGRSLAWRLGGDHQTALPPPVSRPPASRRLAGPEPQPREVPQHPVSARELLRSATAAPPARVCQMDQRGLRSILRMVPVQLLGSDTQRRALSDPPHRCAPALVNFAGQSLQAAPAESGGVAHQIGGCVWTGAPRLTSTRNFRVLDHQASSDDAAVAATAGRCHADSTCRMAVVMGTTSDGSTGKLGATPNGRRQRSGQDQPEAPLHWGLGAHIFGLAICGPSTGLPWRSSLTIDVSVQAWTGCAWIHASWV